MKTLTYFFIFGLFFLLSLGVAASIGATQNYQTGDTLLSDNFNDGNYNGWTDEGNIGGWSVSSSSLLAWKSGTNKGSHLTYGGGGWNNFSLETDVYNNGGIDQGITFRRANANNTYELDLRYGTGIYDTPEIKLIKYQGGNLSVLQSTHNIPLSGNHWDHLKIEAYQEHIQVWWNSSLIFEVDDPGTTVTTGSIGFSYWTGNIGVIIARFDNIVLQSISLVTPTPTSTPTSTPTPTPTPTPTSTPTPTPSPIVFPTAVPTTTEPTATPTPEIPVISDPTPVVLEPTSTPTPSPTPTPIKFDPTTIPTPTSNKLKLEILSTFWPTISPTPKAAVLGLAATGTPVNNQIKQGGPKIYFFLLTGALILAVQGVLITARIRKSKTRKRPS